MADDLILNETDRQKLDGIVQQMIANKEADADIQFVVNDFKSKYGQKKSPSVTTPASPAQPTKDSATVSGQQSGSGEKVSLPKITLGEESLRGGVAKSDVIEKPKMEDAMLLEQQQRGQFKIDESARIKKDITKKIDAANKSAKEQSLKASIVNYLQKLTDHFGGTVAQEGEPTGEPADIDVDIYEPIRLQTETLQPDMVSENVDPQLRERVVIKNSKLAKSATDEFNVAKPYIEGVTKLSQVKQKLGQAQTEYDAATNVVKEQRAAIDADLKRARALNPEKMVELGFTEGFEKSLEQTTIANTIADMYMKGDDDKVKNSLESLYADSVLFPQEETTGGMIGGMIGGQVKPLAVGFGLGALNPALGVVGGSAYYGRMNMGSSMIEAYATARAQGMDADDAYEVATKQAKVGFATGAAEGLVGMVTMGGKPVQSAVTETFKRAVKSTLKEAGVDGAVAGGLKAVENVSMQKLGLDVETDSGVMQEMAAEALFGTAMHMAMFGGKKVLGANYGTIINGIAKMPFNEIQAKVNEAVKAGVLDAAKGEQFLTEVRVSSEAQERLKGVDIPEKKQDTVIELQKQINQTEKDMENASPAVAPALEKRIEDLSAEMQVEAAIPLTAKEKIELNKLQTARDENKAYDKDRLKVLEKRQKAAEKVAEEKLEAEEKAKEESIKRQQEEKAAEEQVVEPTTETIDGAVKSEEAQYDGMFNPEKTGISGIDALIKDDGYNFFYKGVKVEKVMMSPDEYLQRVREGQGTKEGRNVTEEKKKAIIEAIDSGNKINAPFLSTKDGKFNQEGRNRAVVAKERGEKMIPVFIESDVTFDDKINRGAQLVADAMARGKKTQEEIIGDIKSKGLHRDGVYFIENNYEDILAKVKEIQAPAPAVEAPAETVSETVVEQPVVEQPTEVATETVVETKPAPEIKVEEQVPTTGEPEIKPQISDSELEAIIGRDVFKAIQKAESDFGEGVIDRNRLLETAKKIQQIDGKSKLLPEHIFEALQYEIGYPDNWSDLRNAIKKGGIDINSDAVQRQIEVGIKLPKDIVEEFTKSKRYKNASPELVKAVEDLLGKPSAAKEPTKATEQPTDKETMVGKTVTFEHAGSEKSGVVKSVDAKGNLEVEGVGANKGVKYTVKKSAVISEMQEDVAVAKQEAQKENEELGKKINTVIQKAIKKQPTDAKKVIKNMVGFQQIADLPNRLFQNYVANKVRKYEDALAKALQKGSVSQNAAWRNIADFISSYSRGAMDTMEYSEAKRQKLTGGINKAKQDAEDLHGQMWDLIGGDVDSADRVHQVLDPDLRQTGLKYDDLTDAEKDLHDLLKSINEYTHNQNFLLGKISKETYHKYKGKYIGREYDFDKLYDQKIGGKTLREILGIYKQRQEVDAEKTLASIKDPIYLTLRRFMQTGQNMAVNEYAHWLYRNYRQGNAFGNAEMISNTERDGFIKLGQGFGALSDKWVARSIAEDFKGFQFNNDLMQLAYDLTKAYDGFPPRQFMKELLTVFNPQVQIGNMTSNAVFSWLGGVDLPTYLSKAKEAYSEIKNRGQVYRDLQNEGMMGVDFVSTDLKPMQPQIGGRPENAFRKVERGVREFYQGVDDAAKIQLYLSLKDMGYSHKEAVQTVFESLQNYQNTGRIWDLASKTPIVGNAFIKFTPEMLRLLKNGMTRRPLHTLALISLLSSMPKVLGKMFGNDDEEIDAAGRQKGIPKIMIPYTDLEIPLSWRLGDKRVNIARYLMPMYMYDVGGESKKATDLVNKFIPYQLKQTEEGGLTPVNVQDPFVAPLWGILTNKDFRDKPIVEETDDATDATIKRLRYGVRGYGGFYANLVDDIFSTSITGEDYYGRRKDALDVALNVLIKIETFDDERLKQGIIMEFDGYERLAQKIYTGYAKKRKKLDSEIEEIAADKNMSKERKKELIAKKKAKLVDVSENVLEDIADIQEQQLKATEYYRNLSRKQPYKDIASEFRNTERAINKIERRIDGKFKD